MHETDIDTAALLERWVGVWHEPDPDARRATIRELWAPHGIHVLESPPEAIRDAARGLGLPAPSLEARGYQYIPA